MAIATAIRVNRRGDLTEIRCQVHHPMETGRRIDPRDHGPIPAHFIQKLYFELNGRRVAEADTSAAISRDPLFVIRVQGARPGDSVTVKWADNRGSKGQASTVVA